MDSQHILVTTDFSPESAAAFAVARKQAELCGSGSKITLVSVLEDFLATTLTFEFGFAVVDAEDLMRQSHARAVNKLAEVATQYFAGIPTEAIVVRARKPVHREIVDLAKEKAADLLVLATHGRSGIKHLLLGSTTERIIHDAPCPVLVVPSQAS